MQIALHPPALRHLITTLCLGVGICVFLAAGCLAQDRRVDSPEALHAALAEIEGGTIILANGRYGEVELKRKFSKAITLRAEHPRRARFTVIRLIGATNVTLDGLRLEEGLAIRDGAKAITVLNSDVDGILYCRNVEGLMVDNTDVSGGRFGILLNSVRDFTVTHSYVHEVTEDVMRITGDSRNGRIELNILYDVISKKPLHPDMIQFFHAKGIAPRDIIIRRNLIHDNPRTGSVSAQGLFVSDPGRGETNKGYANILLDENLMSVGAPNGLFLNSARRSVMVRGNTMIPQGGRGATVRLVGKVFGDGGPLIEGNAFKAIRNETKAARIGKNLIYGDVALARLFSGSGARWQDYLPVLGSELDTSGLGAARFLADLQAAQKPGAKGGPRLGPDWSELVLRCGRLQRAVG